MTSLEPPPLAVYLHFPWCLSKCPYCDFNSHTQPARPDAERERYVDALLLDIAAQAPLVGSRPVTSMFLGGGTPSLFTPAEIRRVLDACRSALTLCADVEITMEANPGALEHGSFEGYLAAGVNRLSIGGQSFDAGLLKRLGRRHDPPAVARAVDAARAAGFERINVDIMYGLPAQTLEQAVRDAETVVGLGVQHVSHYQLTLEPNTAFHHDPPPLPDDDLIAEMMAHCETVFTDAGLRRYEISALAAPGHACRHNLNYWRYGDYLGIGAGAHGKLTERGHIRRRVRAANPRGYRQQVADGLPPPVSEVGSESRAFEYMLNALRLVDGFRLDHFERHTGLPAEAVRPILAEAERRGLMLDQGDHKWRPSALGLRFLNDLQAMFLS